MLSQPADGKDKQFLKCGQKLQMLTQHSLSLTQVIMEGRSVFFFYRIEIQ